VGWDQKIKTTNNWHNELGLVFLSTSQHSSSGIISYRNFFTYKSYIILNLCLYTIWFLLIYDILILFRGLHAYYSLYSAFRIMVILHKRSWWTSENSRQQHYYNCEAAFGNKTSYTTTRVCRAVATFLCIQTYSDGYSVENITQTWYGKY